MSVQAVSLAKKYGMDTFGARMEQVYAHVLTAEKKSSKRDTNNENADS
jgi:hypothetical protein